MILYFLFCCITISVISGLEKNDTRIIGGELVHNRSEYPYVVSIRLNGYHMCGGSIVNHRHVLTAAHCCYLSPKEPIKPEQLSVRAGDLVLLTNTNETRIRYAEKIIIHELYNPEENKHDIAVIRILGQLTPWNFNIAPVILAVYRPASGSCYVSGWGTTKFNVSILSNHLQSVNVPIVNHSQCQGIFGSIITKEMICAGYSGKDSCQGDSGGPLVCGTFHLLTGIVSWGVDCGKYPGVYTSVPEYLPWIKKHINSSSSSPLLQNPLIFTSLILATLLSNTF